MKINRTSIGQLRCNIQSGMTIAVWFAIVGLFANVAQGLTKNSEYGSQEPAPKATPAPTAQPTPGGEGGTPGMQERGSAKAAEKGKSMSLTGWVKDQDGKTVFINDKDKQAWSIANLDAVKGHEGHHVKVKAKLNEADHSLNVEKLSMMRKGKQTAEAKQKEEKK
ncbi:MAG TPA: hypothetical protein VK517_00545 [Cyclobacteriaceae bacterium]|nr:hypothetical protein [Cyclobacteriaceae bacterium]